MVSSWRCGGPPVTAIEPNNIRAAKSDAAQAVPAGAAARTLARRSCQALTFPRSAEHFAFARQHGNEMAPLGRPFARSGVALQFVPANAHTDNRSAGLGSSACAPGPVFLRVRFPLTMGHRCG